MKWKSDTGHYKVVFKTLNNLSNFSIIFVQHLGRNRFVLQQILLNFNKKKSKIFSEKIILNYFYLFNILYGCQHDRFFFTFEPNLLRIGPKLQDTIKLIILVF